MGYTYSRPFRRLTYVCEASPTPPGDPPPLLGWHVERVEERPRDSARSMATLRRGSKPPRHGERFGTSRDSLGVVSERPPNRLSVWGCSTFDQPRRMGAGDRLLDILCTVCGDRSSGKHYGTYSCDGCSGFFKRSIHENRKYVCKEQGALKGRCPINKKLRNQCRACRLAMCFKAKMNRDAVQHVRGPRKPKPHSMISEKQQSPIDSSDRLRTGPGSGYVLLPSRRLRCDQRIMSYPRPVGLVQKPPEDSQSPVPLALSHSPSTTTLYSAPPSVTLPPQPLLQILMSAEKCQELAWNARPHPESEYSLEQTEASLNSTGTLQTLTPIRESLQETTARLLFMAVRWFRSLPPIQTLSENDQLVLLEGSWTQLFLLHLAQWFMPCNITELLADEQIRERLSKDKAATNQDLITIQSIIRRFRQLAPDVGECGCMKAVALFTPELEGLQAVESIRMLQDQAQCILGDYTSSRYLQQPGRTGTLMYLVGYLKSVSSKTVERLFFHETIGEIPISRLLVNMLQM
ncbi:PREDICTED: nuclear receptor subfamily 2 group E member 1-like [Dufourea novaeangliae]|uniref:nuclear receptor subfamily 2 group E member 1-like n=1 Tax=Dufourea novaeangliae TaxID=178035 RepID=UPI000767BE99|nr:PREDICTED: nuclear receptor subfamily 2 group E member 1-like [Dufourea novaeangliae]